MNMRPNDNMFMIVLVISVCAMIGFSDYSEKTNNRPVQKPFIITGKNIENWHFTGEAEFEYCDANGNHTTFTDSGYKYNIGDTMP